MMNRTLSAEDIKALRDKLGLSREDFAHEVGATAMSVYRWEASLNKPGKMAKRLLEQLKERVDEEERARERGEQTELFEGRQ